MSVDDIITPICIAPMVDVTDMHWRNFFRLFSRKTKVYGPMIVDDAVIFGSGEYTFLASKAEEHPVAFQLGGSSPEKMATAAAKVEAHGGFCEINLNFGCPSPTVNKHKFGARLMRDPEHVRQLIYNVNRHVTHTPITVKCRVGCDGSYDYAKLHDFIQHVKDGGTDHIIVHARTCYLDGISAARNRSVPPLDYSLVHRLVADFPDMKICLNGGVDTFEGALVHLQGGQASADGSQLPPVHSVMYGRAAWHNPWLFRHADSVFFGTKDPGFTRRQIVERYLDYMDGLADDVAKFNMLANDDGGTSTKNNSNTDNGDNHDSCHDNSNTDNNEEDTSGTKKTMRRMPPNFVLLRPLQHLFASTTCGRAFRRITGDLYENKVKQGEMTLVESIHHTLDQLPAEILDEPVGESLCARLI